MKDSTRAFSRGQIIYRAGDEGHAWRILTGSVRLDLRIDDERMFGGLARPGDVIGAEAIAEDAYAFDAVALSECRLAPWAEDSGSADRDSVLQLLAAVERRAAEALALRRGNALDRVRRLILMLADGRGNTIAIPLARDIAEMTDLTAETVSRAFTVLRRQGTLTKHGSRFGLVQRGELQAI